MTELAKTLGLFTLTAVAEILGCYLPYLWLRHGRFVWLLTLHPQAAGRVYAAYGGVYVSVALLWLWAVDSVRPSFTDWLGVGVALLGMAIIMFGPRHV